jgi:hypothetical protein
MKNRPFRIAAGIAMLLALGGAALGPDQASQAASKPIRLAAATMIIEVDATARDAGLQFFLDGEPWRSMKVSAPNGSVILDVNAEGSLKGFGLTELFSESNEPPFNEFPLEKFKALFPEGRYSFAGTTIAGERVVGSARLSHDIPDGPRIISPADAATVARTGVVVRWAAPAAAPGIVITGYRVIVTREDPLRVFSVDLPASANRLPVPAEFLESGTEYQLEIQAIEESGNQTFRTSTFLVR